MNKKKTLSVAERKKLENEREQTQAELERLREYLKTTPEPAGDEVGLMCTNATKILRSSGDCNKNWRRLITRCALPRKGCMAFANAVASRLIPRASPRCRRRRCA